MSKLMTFSRRSIKTSNFNKNITHNLPQFGIRNSA